MPTTTYQNLLHSTALRVNALVGSQAATLEATYATAVLTSANFRSADWPFSSFIDAILQAEEDFVTAIAFTGQHPWRSVIRGVTAPLSTNVALPTTDSNTKPAIGLWGAVYDAADFTPLVEMPLDVIVRRTRNANSHYITPVYYYKIDGQIIHHTCASVRVECCIYSRTDQAVAFAANAAMLLPDLAEPGITARALSYLFRDGAFVEQAAAWRRYSDDALTQIRAGSTSIVSRSIPEPVTNTKAA